MMVHPEGTVVPPNCVVVPIVVMFSAPLVDMLPSNDSPTRKEDIHNTSRSVESAERFHIQVQ